MGAGWIATAAVIGILVAGSAFAAGAAKGKAAAKSVGSPDDVAVMETSKGRMVIEFWPKDAPKTVANFKKLARSGFYNGTGFHRIIAGFMVQGGDPKSKNPKAPDLGTGGPGWTIPDEFNNHKHEKGVLSMAHTAEPNSGGSQFFLMHGAAPFLDHKYTAFGHVIEGMDVVDAIANVRTAPNPMMPGENSKPLEWVTIKSVKIVPRAVAMGGGAKAAVATEKAASAKAAGKAADAKNEAAEKAAEKATDAKESADKAAESAKKAGAKAAEAAQSANEAAKAAGTDSSAAK
jgi:peptidyl-prolyl cis-trans isomerase B (cyclophilin B)